jgi:hypothetical protein
VFAWRKLYEAGLLRSRNAAPVGPTNASCRLLPVTVSADSDCRQPPTALAISTQRGGDREPVTSPGWIELTLAKTQVRITGDVDAGVLRTVLEWLRG